MRASVLPRPSEVRHDRTRVVGLDIARALALVGMMATHLLVSVDEDGVIWYQQLAGGRSAALFAVLAGVSISIMTGRERPVRGAVRAASTAGLVVRALLIALVGLLLGPLDTTIAIVLTYYGVLFLFGLPFVGLGWKALAGWAGAVAVIAPVVSHLVRQQIEVPVFLDNPSLERLQYEPSQLFGELTFTGYYPTVPWLAYLLAGMAIGRCALGSRRVAIVLLTSGAALAAAAWGISWWLLNVVGGREHLAEAGPGTISGLPLDLALVRGLHGTTPTTTWWWLTVSAPHSGTPFDLLHTIGIAMVVIGGCLLLGQLAGGVLRWVFAAGTMTLSLYTAHVLAIHWELGPTNDPVDLYVRHVATAFVAAAGWLAVVGRGPLEEVVRTMSSGVQAAVLSLADRLKT